MNAQRSMTDEQLLAKYGYDKEPWVAVALSGEALEVRFDEPERYGYQTRFAPRPECVPSRFDHRFTQEEFAVVADDWRCAFCGVRREEHGRIRVNPILSAFRVYSERWTTTPLTMLAKGYEQQVFDIASLLNATPDQLEFARAVLTRLANLTAVTS